MPISQTNCNVIRIKDFIWRNQLFCAPASNQHFNLLYFSEVSAGWVNGGIDLESNTFNLNCPLSTLILISAYSLKFPTDVESPLWHPDKAQ